MNESNRALQNAIALPVGRSPMPYKYCAVPMKIWPSDIAGVLKQYPSN
jgi:hypothetical protein